MSDLRRLTAKTLITLKVDPDKRKKFGGELFSAIQRSSVASPKSPKHSNVGNAYAPSSLRSQPVYSSDEEEPVSSKVVPTPDKEQVKAT